MEHLWNIVARESDGNRPASAVFPGETAEKRSLSEKRSNQLS
jgi:hypothetical protein